MKTYDVAIIGGGVCGASIAREVSRYKVSACVIEREEDICCGSSKANSGVVHAGYDAVPGTMKARMNVEGTALMPALAKDLGIDISMRGTLVACTDESRLDGLYELYERGLQNGVSGFEVIEDRSRIFEIEPNLNPATVAVLFAAHAGIICPFSLTTALAENAFENGVEFLFETNVSNIARISKDSSPRGQCWEIQTNRGPIRARCVVNAAGIFADELHNMVSETKIHITPRRGDYMLLDKTSGSFVRHTIFTLPGPLGKGVLVSPTVHGNILVGPTAIDVDDKESTATTLVGLDQIRERCAEIVKDAPLRSVITSFAGLRAHEDGGDFIIGEVPDAPGFIDCAGIESPGLSASPAIGQYVAKIVADILKPAPNPHFNGHRDAPIDIDRLDLDELSGLVARYPEFGNIICRCERVSEGEIVDAIRRPLGARSLDGAKRRVRAGMGRCQGGFCSPKVMEILSRELGLGLDEITKSGGAARVLVGKNKDGL